MINAEQLGFAFDVVQGSRIDATSILLQWRLPLPYAVVVFVHGFLSPVSVGLPAFHGPLCSPIEDLVSSFMGYGLLGLFVGP